MSSSGNACGKLVTAIDDFVTDDFVLTTEGVDVVSRATFKEWAAAQMAQIIDLRFELIETFQNEDGSRVASRWRIAGKNNGILGTPPDHQPISYAGMTIFGGAGRWKALS